MVGTLWVMVGTLAWYGPDPLYALGLPFIPVRDEAGFPHTTLADKDENSAKCLTMA